MDRKEDEEVSISDILKERSEVVRIPGARPVNRFKKRKSRRRKKVRKRKREPVSIEKITTLGEERILHEKGFPPKAIEPKVWVPYKNPPNGVPRKIVIERRRRLYNSMDIEKLLKERSIDFSGVSKEEKGSTYENYLPLESFDDTRFDCRNPEEWVSLGKVLHEDGSELMHFVPAITLERDDDGKGDWIDCRIIDVNPEENLFLVETENREGTTKQEWKPRIYIMFKAENPIDFADRVAHAFKARKRAESLLRYNLYIDNMPTDEIPPLNDRKVDNIRDRSLSTVLLRKNQEKLSVTGLIREVVMTYERTMNKIIFDKNLEDKTHGDLFQFLSLPEMDDKKKVDKERIQYGLVKIPNYNFKSHSRKFKFNTFLSEKCVISTLLNVKKENLEKERMRILNLGAQRKVTHVEDFRNLQEQSIKRLREHLREQWKYDIVNTITTNFKKVGKGWMNIYEKKLAIYNMSKLKRFMNVVKLMMEDSLRFMMEDSLTEFVKFLSEVNRYEVKVVSPTEVENKDKISQNTLKKKIFTLELLDNEKEGLFFYSTPVERYSKIVDDLYMAAIEQFQEIPNVEQTVMKNLYLHGQISNLNAISLKNGLDKEYPHILSWRNEAQKQIKEAVAPLTEYLKLYDRYLPLLKRDEASYAKQFESEDHSLEDYKLEIQQHLREQNEVMKSIPVRIEVGTFLVDCQKVRNRLSKKCYDQARRILDLLATLGKTKTTHITREFGKLSGQLNKRVENIIVLTKVREFMNEMAEKVSDLQKDIDEMKAFYDLLDVFKFEVNNEEFRNKCLAMSWPKKLYEQRERVEVRLVKDEERFKEIMERKQEEFKAELDRIETEVAELARRTDFGKVKENAKDIKTLQNQIKQCKQKAAKYNEKESLFGSDITEYQQIRAIENNIRPYADLWLTAYDWITWQTSWLQDPFNKLDAKKMDDDVSQARRKISKCVMKFKDNPSILSIAKEIQDRIMKFVPNLPIIIALRNEGIRPRHWAAISKAINIRLVVGETIKNLNDILHLGLGDYIETIQKISEIAAKEYTIEDSLQKMKSEWEATNFTIIEYKDTGTFVLKMSDEFQQQLDDHIAMTQTISFSAFKGEFEKEIEEWNRDLNLVSEIVDEWLNCQREWMALEPIFSSAELIKQLPNLYKKFKQVDTKFRKLMDSVHHTPSVLRFCEHQKILLTFRTNNQILSQIQKGLFNYLETKRKQFARLYFLADDELLTILAKAKEPETIQPYLKKCFQNIKSVKFEAVEPEREEDEDDRRVGRRNEKTIVSMTSPGGEEIEFVTPVEPKGSVEIWLREVEFQMCLSMKKELRNAILDYIKTKRGKWLLSWPGQIIVVGSQLFWTKEVTETLNKYGNRGLKNYYKKLKKQIDDVTVILSEDVTSLERIKLSSLLTIDVHGRDVVKTMRDNECTSTTDFEWINQLRFYWERHDIEEDDDLPVSFEEEEEEKEPNYDCIVRQVEAEFVYGYEYLGNTSRLVITPLTDRIYLTLTGALKMILGGSPAGPAGTGKTETVKDLAKAVAKQCVVFNCSEGLNEFAMGKFFKGLVMAGAWACFDEFNRIDIEVLSVVAQQITTLQEAIRANLKEVEFENTTVSVDPTFAVFITMNPGYAGRTELPDNLKALFRSVACMIPDYALIAEIRLFSYGFKRAKPLSKKMVATFKLSSEQLSSQDHYDFGMRALNTVIASAGLLKRENPFGDEDVTLLRALVESNEPKFLENDVELFGGIISDLFPETKKPKAKHGKLMSQLISSCKELGFDPNESFLEKCIQLYQTIVLRHGLMIVGLSGSGKTTNYRVLQHALTKLANDQRREKTSISARSHTSSYSQQQQQNKEKKEEETEGEEEEGEKSSRNGGGEEKVWKSVETTIINPKSVTMSQLYGEYDQNTREWCDGVLANEFKKFAMEETEHLKWLIFDGPVDALWIESMNTVLDDNRKLCLVSGAIIELSPTMNILFEVEDLAVASPATVSRCGMVYMNPKNVGIESLLKCWFLRIPDTLEVLKSNLDVVEKVTRTVLPECINFIMKNEDLFTYVPKQVSNFVNTFFDIMDCLFKPYYMSKEELLMKSEDEKEEHYSKLKRIPRMIEPMILFSVIWSTAGATDLRGREKFDSFFRSKILPQSSESRKFPTKGLVYDYTYHETELRWVSWLYGLKPFVMDKKMKFSDIIIPTIDTVRYKWLIRKLLLHGKHVLAVGPTGTGKSLVVNETIMNLGPKYIPIQVFFSARTSVNQTQDIIDSKIERRKKGVYGPTPGMKNVIFIDDLNMPQKEKYGAQPPIELIRQWMDHKGWYEYNSEKLAFRKVIETLFVTAMGPPGGGRTAISNRLLRHFNTIAFCEIQDETIYRIFHTMLDQWVRKNLSEKFHTISSDIVTSSISLYNATSQVMLPTPSRSHYTFNLRDIAKVFQGMMDANPKKILQIRDIMRLWIHECRRVFRDRLVDENDRNSFEKLIQDQLEGTFEVSWTDVVDPTQRLLYGDYMSPTSVERKAYEEVVNMEDLMRDMMGQLEYYNSTSDQSMDLVLFLDAIEHVSRIARILRQKGGHALLLGVGGSGRRSATKLASFMADYKLFQVEIVKGFSQKDWRDFLKEMMKMTGLNEEDQEFVFLFCDNEILYEQFLEDINNMLNSGDVPNIYDPNDLDEIYQVMKKVCRLEKLPMNPTSWFSRYVKQVKNNLHVVIAMSPQGEIFRNRLRMFPSLVNCCTIDWFSNWPTDALVSVAEEKLKSMVLGSSEERKGVLDMCAYIHHSVEKMSDFYFERTGRRNYVTPTNYLELLATFVSLHSQNLREIDQEKTKFERGLETLKSTEKEVDQLQKKLKEKKPRLIETQEQIKVNVETNKKNKLVADETEVRIKAHQEKVSKKESECAEYKKKCEEELAEALPALKNALQDLKKLKKSDVMEVSSYKKYTDGVRMTLEAVCIMFEIRPEKVKDPKNPGKTTLSYEEPGRKFCKKGEEAIQMMVKYDVNNIPKRIISRIQKYVENKEVFNPIRVAKASKAAKSMCQFVIAMYNYYHCKKKVEPLERELKKAEKDMNMVTDQLRAANEELEKIQSKIQFLNNENQKMMVRQRELAEEVQNCNTRLSRARKLTQGLASEKEQWVKNLMFYREREKNIIGDMLVAAGSVAYFGSFSYAFRDRLRKEWLEQLKVHRIKFDENFELTDLADPVSIQKWVRDEGLPFDKLSIQNAVILNTVFNKASMKSDKESGTSIKWPLFIDPQLQANKWVKMREKGNLKVINFNQKDYMRDLLNGIQFGTPVLLENVGEVLNPDIEPILIGQKTLKGGTYYIKIGESEYHYNSGFRLYISTKLRNPHYAPETSAKVTLLNFFITPDGLQDQLLGTVVAMERPELERMKMDLMENNMKFAKQLKDLQNHILQTLDENKDDILGSDHLIRALQQSQHKSRQVEDKLDEAKKTEKEIDLTRDKYRRVAMRGSILFFCVSDMANIDPMYQYSLQWFINLFKQGVTNAEESEEMNLRIQNLIQYFTGSLYVNVCQSLFEKHKMLFSFVLTIRILQGEGKLDKAEWRFFLTGSSKKPSSIEIPSSENWINEKIWNEVLNISGLEFFGEDFLKTFTSLDRLKRWEAFYNSNDVTKMEIPFKTPEEMTPFKRLLILRCLRPDKVSESIIDFVTHHMGKRFVEPPRFDLFRSYKSSTCRTPLVFILSPGADPKHELDRFAVSMGKKYFESVSLGRGTERKATDAVREASTTSNWVLLQNCHLAKSYMRPLESIVEEFETNEELYSENSEFRLWLTSMPDSNFPVSILQNSVKMTLEPPKGMKANLLRSYSDYEDKDLVHETKPVEFKKLLFSLCFFHAVVQERRKFGPLGWNISYEFTKGDLDICVRQLRMFLENYESVPYQIIRFLSGEINYGGRVTDDWDRRTIKSIIDTYIGEHVLEDDFKFCPLEEYRSIPATDHQGYLNYLESLPSLTDPQVLGFHLNAIITSNTSEFTNICDTILGMIPKGTTSGGAEMQNTIMKQAEHFLSVIPKPFDFKHVKEKFPTKYEESMNTVIVQEVEKYNRLLNLIDSSLKDLIKAIKGLVVMSQELENMMSSIFDNQVPSTWKQRAYPSVMPLNDWVLNLITRCRFIQKWIDNGTPSAFWISGFYFPQGFLTGILQNYARKYKVAIDRISFDFKILNEMDHRQLSSPEDGCYIYGVFLEGSRMSMELKKEILILDESRPKILYERVPVIKLKPVVDRVKKEEGVYVCPLYKTLRRAGTLSTTGHSTNYIIGIEVPTEKKNEKHWIERGVAMICALNYHTEIQF